MQGRPVVYSCIRQERAGVRHTPEATNLHMIYALEEAIKTMDEGVTQWVWAMDMRGMGLKHCSLSLPQHMNALFSKHYPETLGMVRGPRAFPGTFVPVPCL